MTRQLFVLGLVLVVAGCGGEVTPECPMTDCVSIGATRCNEAGTAIEECAVVQGCNAWRLLQSCADSSMVCVEDPATCVPPCTSGELRCTESGMGVEWCTENGWEPLVDCDVACEPSLSVCVGKTSCTALESALGEALATGSIGEQSDELQICEAYDLGLGQDVCLTWKPPASGMYRFTGSGTTFEVTVGLDVRTSTGFSFSEYCADDRTIYPVYAELEEGDKVIVYLDANAPNTGTYSLSIVAEPPCTNGERRCRDDLYWEWCQTDGEETAWSVTAVCPNGCNLSLPGVCL
ncbi:MAG: hypothetical protein JW797_04415 [Bradymonadales bacterium]|nr:hypothetical protein [Bradymonadales bacterium]